jgi:hypothetical protein
MSIYKDDIKKKTLLLFALLFFQIKCQLQELILNVKCSYNEHQPGKIVVLAYTE